MTEKRREEMLFLEGLEKGWRTKEDSVMERKVMKKKRKQTGIHLPT